MCLYGIVRVGANYESSTQFSSLKMISDGNPVVAPVEESQGMKRKHCLDGVGCASSAEVCMGDCAVTARDRVVDLEMYAVLFA